MGYIIICGWLHRSAQHEQYARLFLMRAKNSRVIYEAVGKRGDRCNQSPINFVLGLVIEICFNERAAETVCERTAAATVRPMHMQREMNINGRARRRGLILCGVSQVDSHIIHRAADTFDCHTIMLDNELLSARLWQLNKLSRVCPELFRSWWKKVLVYSFWENASHLHLKFVCNPPAAAAESAATCE